MREGGLPPTHASPKAWRAVARPSSFSSQRKHALNVTVSPPPSPTKPPACTVLVTVCVGRGRPPPKRKEEACAHVLTIPIIMRVERRTRCSRAARCRVRLTQIIKPKGSVVRERHDTTSVEGGQRHQAKGGHAEGLNANCHVGSEASAVGSFSTPPAPSGHP